MDQLLNIWWRMLPLCKFYPRCIARRQFILAQYIDHSIYVGTFKEIVHAEASSLTGLVLTASLFACNSGGWHNE